MRADTDAQVAPVGRADVVRCWAGFASLGAGLVHVAVVHEHLAEWWVYGGFFAVVGAAQIGWGLLAMARDRAPYAGAVASANVALVALWALSRTAGLPVGPEAWTAEPAGRADLLCVALEVATVLALAVLPRLAGRPLDPSGRRPGAASGRYVALLFAGALTVAAVATPALAATEAGGHAHPHGVHGS